MMNNERKRSSNCDQDAHQTSRPERRRLDGPSVDVLGAKEPNLDKLPSNCLKHILSIMTFEKVSQMRQVSKKFNEISKRLLDEGHQELDRRLERESERAKKRVLFPINIRSSYNMFHFLNDLQEAINFCKKGYLPPVDYFMAGKLLDEANCLLNDFKNSKVVPYFNEHAYDQKPHPILGPILAHCDKADRHFYTKILDKYITYDEEADLELYDQSNLKKKLLCKRNKMRIAKINVLKNQKQKIDCGNQLSEQFLKLIVQLNENVLGLTQMANKVDEELQQINKKGNMPIVPTNQNLSNCHYQLAAPFSAPLGETKLLGGPNEQRANVATLPPLCIQNIVSYLKCDKMAQLRIVCKSFNEACKKELNEEFEKLYQKCAFRIKYDKQNNYHGQISPMRVRPSLVKDLYSFLQQCKNNYRSYLGSKFYFAAGKVLDEAECIRYRLHTLQTRINPGYKSRPYFSLFPLMDLVHKAIIHFKFKVIPKYFPLTQNPISIPDYIVTGDAINLENENQLNLEEIEKLIEETDVRIIEQNIRNRKYLNIISGLKKTVFILNKEISERYYTVLKKLK